MKKGKIVALLSLSVLTLGVVAGGIASDGGFFSELDAGEVIPSGGCSLSFGKNNFKTENGVDYLHNGYTRLKVVNGKKGKSGIELKAGGTIGTDGTVYTAERGWGSVINHLDSVSIGLVSGKMQLSVGFDLNEEFYHFDQVILPTGDTSLTKISMPLDKNNTTKFNLEPRYFTLTALEDTVVFGVEAFAADYKHSYDLRAFDNLQASQNYVATYTVTGVNDADGISNKFVLPFVYKESSVIIPNFKLSADGKSFEENGITELKVAGKEHTDNDYILVEKINSLYSDLIGFKTAGTNNRFENLTPINGIYNLSVMTIVKPVACSEITIKANNKVVADKFDIFNGESAILKAYTNPADATSLVTWTTSDPTSIKIEPNGKNVTITALKVTEGTTITASCDKVSKSITVVASEKPVALPQGLIDTGTYKDSNGVVMTFSNNDDSMITLSEPGNGDAFWKKSEITITEPAQGGTVYSISCSSDRNSWNYQMDLDYDTSTNIVKVTAVDTDYTFNGIYDQEFKSTALPFPDVLKGQTYFLNLDESGTTYATAVFGNNGSLDISDDTLVIYNYVVEKFTIEESGTDKIITYSFELFFEEQIWDTSYDKLVLKLTGDGKLYTVTYGPYVNINLLASK